MTTDQHAEPEDALPQPDTTEDETAEPAIDPMDEARALLDSIADLDPADAVEPLTRVTSLLNDALDEVKERL